MWSLSQCADGILKNMCSRRHEAAYSVLTVSFQSALAINQAGKKGTYLRTEQDSIVPVMGSSGSSVTDRLVYGVFM